MKMLDDELVQLKSIVYKLVTGFLEPMSIAPADVESELKPWLTMTKPRIVDTYAAVFLFVRRRWSARTT